MNPHSVQGPARQLPVITEHEVTQARFRQADASVGLWSSSPVAGRTAIDTLYAYDVGASDTAAAWQVRIIASALVPAQLGPGATEGLAYDIGPRLTAYRRGDTWTVPELSSMITVAQHPRTVTVWCPPQHAAHWTVRLVRQVMTGQLLSCGAVYAHAAAVTVGGVGVAIAGFKHRGKTTTMLAALQHLGANLISNDRLLLQPDTPRTLAHAWPQGAHLGIGTLSAFPDLADLVPAGLRGLGGGDLWGYPHKIVVEPPDFPRLLRGGTVAGFCPIDVLVWPELTPGRCNATAQRVTPAEVRTVLTSTRLFMLDPSTGHRERVNDWLGTAHPPTAALETIVEQLAAVPCFRLRGGTDPTALAAVIADLAGYSGAAGW